jgi:hypothetical protein
VIYFDLRFENGSSSTTTTVSIRKLPADLHAYEIRSGKDRHRGTIRHIGTEDIRLVAAVLNDYLRTHAG